MEPQVPTGLGITQATNSDCCSFHPQKETATSTRHCTPTTPSSKTSPPPATPTSKAYSDGFRAVGCTEATSTPATTTRHDSTPVRRQGRSASTGSAAPRSPTTTEDFYDNTWDNETDSQRQRTSSAPTPPTSATRPTTHGPAARAMGPSFFDGSSSRALGKTAVQIGRPGHAGGPIGGLISGTNSTSGPMYALSQLFDVVPTSAPGIPTGMSTTVGRATADRPVLDSSRF